MEILLYAPEYRPNLSNMIRSAEFFGFSSIYIYDANQLLEPPKNKANRADMNHMARVWTAGAIEFMDIRKVMEVQHFIQHYKGRTLATFVDTSATHLSTFSFRDNDLLIMGSEKDGLPVDIVKLCDEALYIPAIGHTDCLNVSVSLGIFLYAAQNQKT